MLFIWTIGNVIITQYGSVIMDNIMSNQLNNAEELANSFLRYDNSRLMVVAFNVTMKIRYPYFNAVFWERDSKKDPFHPFFKYPQTFAEKKIILEEFKDYFMIFPIDDDIPRGFQFEHLPGYRSGFGVQAHRPLRRQASQYSVGRRK